MQPLELFLEVVRSSKELPADVRLHVDEASGVGETCFDESYIAFLDEQIQLSPRGPEWAEILKRRREILLPFCNITLVSGQIRSGGFIHLIKIDPKTKTIVNWEQAEYSDQP